MGTRKRSVVIIVENLPVPMDRRVWMEATTLHKFEYQVSVICPTGKGCESLYEELDGVHIYRHTLPPEGTTPLGYLRDTPRPCGHSGAWRAASTPSAAST